MKYIGVPQQNKESSLSPTFSQSWLYFHRILVCAPCSCAEAQVPFNFHKNQVLILSMWLLLSSHKWSLSLFLRGTKVKCVTLSFTNLVILPQKFLLASCCSCAEAVVPWTSSARSMYYTVVLCTWLYFQKLSSCLSVLVVGWSPCAETVSFMTGCYEETCLVINQ